MKDDTITFNSGVVVKLKRVEPLLVHDAINDLVVPEVPKILIKDKNYEEENPNDPKYIQAVKRYEQDRADRIEDTLIVLGTEIQSTPKDFSKADDSDWSERFEAIGMKIFPVGSIKRYLQWFRLWVLRGNADDIANFFTSMNRLQGIVEEDVAEVATSFRDTKKRGANRTARPEKAS